MKGLQEGNREAGSFCRSGEFVRPACIPVYLRICNEFWIEDDRTINKREEKMHWYAGST